MTKDNFYNLKLNLSITTQCNVNENLGVGSPVAVILCPYKVNHCNSEFFGRGSKASRLLK